MKEIKLIKKTDREVRKISNTYTVFNMLTGESSKNVSVAVGEAKNHIEETKNKTSDRVYYVLEGSLKVKSGNKSFVANLGDVIFIPANTTYKFEGTFKVVLINSPPFNSKNEEIKKLIK